MLHDVTCEGATGWNFGCSVEWRRSTSFAVFSRACLLPGRFVWDKGHALFVVRIHRFVSPRFVQCLDAGMHIVLSRHFEWLMLMSLVIRRRALAMESSSGRAA